MKLRPNKTELRVLEDICIKENEKRTKTEKENAFLRESKAILYHEKMQLLETIKSLQDQNAFLREVIMRAVTKQEGGGTDVASTSSSAE